MKFLKIAILGGTGFIGSALSEYLQMQGHQVVIFTRNPKVVNKQSELFIKWPLDPTQVYGDIDGIVNLAGETINQRWTHRGKERIMTSRIESTRQLIEAIQQQILQPKVLINASAIGYYGTSMDRTFLEKDESGDDFLAKVTSSWEAEAEKAVEYGVRVVKARFGLVLDKHGGALPKMLLPYKMYIGGTVGTGRQWVSWIHLLDAIGLISFALHNQSIEGAINVTAPQPVMMKQFGQITGEILKRPHWAPVPSIVLKLMLGEMSDLLLKGQRVLPQKALDNQYKFKFPSIRDALIDIQGNF